MNPTGTQPAFPPAPEPLAGNAPRATIATHEAIKKEITGQKTFILLLKSRLNSVLSDDAKAAIEMHFNGGLPFNQLTPHQVITGFRATQMTYLVQDHALTLDFLQDLYDGSPMPTWISKRNQKIRTAADNGMAISTHDQKIFIRTALAHTPGFGAFMDTYHQTTPEVEQTMAHLHAQLTRHFKYQESVKSKTKLIRGAANTTGKATTIRSSWNSSILRRPCHNIIQMLRSVGVDHKTHPHDKHSVVASKGILYALLHRRGNTDRSLQQPIQRNKNGACSKE